MVAKEGLGGKEFIESFVEDLKCCGNCTHRESYAEDVSREYCNHVEENMPSSGICNKWEFDGSTKEIRERLELYTRRRGEV